MPKERKEDGGQAKGIGKQDGGKLREGKLGGNGAMEGRRPRTTCGNDSRRPSKGDGEVIKRPKTSDDGRNSEENMADKTSSRRQRTETPDRNASMKRRVRIYRTFVVTGSHFISSFFVHFYLFHAISTSECYRV